MKRCIVCGNIEPDDSTVCSICGNPLIDMEDTPDDSDGPAQNEDDMDDMEEQLRKVWAKVQSEEPFDDESSKEEQPIEESWMDEFADEPDISAADETVIPEKKPAESDTAPKVQVRPRRMKSEPQIYGRDTAEGYEGAQGVIRRDVHGDTDDNVQVKGDSQISVEESPVRVGTDSQKVRKQPVSQEAGSRQKAQTPAASLANSEERGKRPSNAQKTAAAQTQPVAQMPQDKRNHQTQATKKSGKTKRIMKASQKAVGSPLLILSAVFLTVCLISSVAAIFTRQLNYGITATLLNNFSFPSEIDGYVSSFQSLMNSLDEGMMAANLAILVPDFLLCIALWVLFVTARTKKDRMSVIGFVILQIVVILNMVLACAALLVVLVLAVVLVISAWSSGTGGVIAFSIVALVLSIAATMVIVMYYFCYLSTVKGMRINARKGESYGRASVYVAVVHIVLSLYGVISLLSGIENEEITGDATGVSKIAWMALLGIWILTYRSKIKKYEE